MTVSWMTVDSTDETGREERSTPETISRECHRESHLYSIDRIEKQMVKNIRTKHELHLVLMMLRAIFNISGPTPSMK
jgi:hypothetical protein